MLIALFIAAYLSVALGVALYRYEQNSSCFPADCLIGLFWPFVLLAKAGFVIFNRTA